MIRQPRAERTARTAKTGNARRTKRKSALVPPIQKIKPPGRGSDAWGICGDRVCWTVSIEWAASMPDSQPCGRIVVCTRDRIHDTRADALDDAIAQPGGRRLRSLHDAPQGWRGPLKIELQRWGRIRQVHAAI